MPILYNRVKMATAVKISGARMDSKSANTWKKDFSCNRRQSIAVARTGGGSLALDASLFTFFASFFLSSG